ncbi:LysR family transcriptional regulator [Bacillus sp. V59.32b]|uniref:LysR family transcriptional regulator n=1 Tax=Bacillus sp. V59.32b TaxID=1758642 RepID=UPI000E3BA631|nr:LysR family transcriptional regulator [Bacillus sp. V59.32b]RFU70191.1 LysR family transcriptional regulator [Bacillus sp. V59.32b]
MELKWLKTFETAATYENFRQASEKLFISQPSVTVHIKLLEGYLGSKLFERSGRKVVLTEEGRCFLPHARKLLAIHSEGMKDFENFKQGFSRKLTIAISPLIAASIMPFILRKYMSIHPDISIDIQVLESKEIPAAILSGKADLGLSRMNTVHTDLTCMPLYEDPVILVAPHDGWDSENSPPIEMEELFASYRIMSHNHPEYWDDLLQTIKRNHPSIRTMVVSQVHVTKKFIEEGLGISFLPVSTVRRELMEGRLLEVRTDSLPLPVSHSYFLTKYQHSEGREFFEFLKRFNFT